MQPRTAIDVLVGFSRLVSEGDVPPEAVLERLADVAVGRVGVAALVVVEVDGRGRSKVALARNLTPELGGVEDLGEDLERAVTDAAGVGPDAITTLPLISGGGLFGAVVLVWGDQTPTALDLQLAEGLVDLTAVALDRAERTRSLHETLDELRASREALARKETLEALGQMAAIVAHEVKNPLASVSGALQVLSGRFDSASAEGGIIERLLERVKDLGQMLDELLLFARPRAPVPTRLSLLDLCARSVEALRADPRFPDLDLRVDVAPKDATLLADGAQLRGVLLNLLLNAAQATEGRGCVKVVGRLEGGRVRIEIHDTGPGVPPEARDRIFEPFFTTKTRGSGLGLAVARQVMEAHDGSLGHRPADEGEGSIFVLELPS